MQKQFLFVTTLTPKRLLSSVRSALFDIYMKSLVSQTYKDWKVLLIGEENTITENFIQIKSTKEDKISKLGVALDYIKSLYAKPDYVIRLDDDDIISSFVLETASKIDFDCYADFRHHFFDIVHSNYCSQ